MLNGNVTGVLFGKTAVEAIPKYEKNDTVNRLIKNYEKQIKEIYPYCVSRYEQTMSSCAYPKIMDKDVPIRFSEKEKLSWYQFVVKYIIEPPIRKKEYRLYQMGAPIEANIDYTMEKLIDDLTRYKLIAGFDDSGSVVYDNIREYFEGKKSSSRGKNQETIGLINRLKEWHFDIDLYPNNAAKYKLLYMLFDYEKSENVHLGHFFNKPTLEDIDELSRQKLTTNGDITRYFKTQIVRELGVIESIQWLNKEFGLNRELGVIQNLIQSDIDCCYNIAIVKEGRNIKEQEYHLNKIKQTLSAIYNSMPNANEITQQVKKSDKQILKDFYARLELHELEGRMHDIVDVYKNIYLSEIDWSQKLFVKNADVYPVKILLAQLRDGLIDLGYDCNDDKLQYLLSQVRIICWEFRISALYQDEVSHIAQIMLKCKDLDNGMNEVRSYLKLRYSSNIKIDEIVIFAEQHIEELTKEILHKKTCNAKEKKKVKTLSEYASTYIKAKQFVQNRRLAMADDGVKISLNELVQSLREMNYFTTAELPNPFYRRFMDKDKNKNAKLISQMKKNDFYSEEFLQKNAYAFFEISRIREYEARRGLQLFKTVRSCVNIIDKITLKFYSYGNMEAVRVIVAQVAKLLECATFPRYQKLLREEKQCVDKSVDYKCIYFKATDGEVWSFKWLENIDMSFIFSIINPEIDDNRPMMKFEAFKQFLKNDIVRYDRYGDSEFLEIEVSKVPYISIKLNLDELNKIVLLYDYEIRILT